MQNWWHTGKAHTAAGQWGLAASGLSTHKFPNTLQTSSYPKIPPGHQNPDLHLSPGSRGATAARPRTQAAPRAGESPWIPPGMDTGPPLALGPAETCPQSPASVGVTQPLPTLQLAPALPPRGPTSSEYPQPACLGSIFSVLTLFLTAHLLGQVSPAGH